MSAVRTKAPHTRGQRCSFGSRSNPLEPHTIHGKGSAPGSAKERPLAFASTVNRSQGLVVAALVGTSHRRGLHAV